MSVGMMAVTRVDEAVSTNCCQTQWRLMTVGGWFVCDECRGRLGFWPRCWPRISHRVLAFLYILREGKNGLDRLKDRISVA
ncbi:proline-rich receptor-like protein kinase PERK2 [Iris pallida]|uniref:Proline-rich receptor-like protein kinase PERK2 n=1 Tax=Iris pallida TaxID=29817 RepID=A0AAX6FL62_IRIPA|nr:proline-rich receptor-like protein kinase PERK2 [Iris pallida]KAJ6817080.1 proline-rich receptor-like protein kinase PERK2 [Iris pallida]